GRQPEARAGVDDRVLEGADVGDDVHRRSQPDDRVDDDLAGAVPRDAAAPVDVDDGAAVDRTVGPGRALAGRVDRLVLEDEQRVPGSPGHHLLVDGPLQVPSGLVVDAALTKTDATQVH